MSFKVGDVVVLKSGGPDMTVAAVVGDEAKCVWFEKGKKCEETFPLVMLREPYPPVGPILT